MFRGTALAALVLAAAAAVGDAGARWADVAVVEQRENATVALLVVNRAPSAVTLASCAERYEVPAGGNTALQLTGLTGFWIVPAGVQWDCHKGPFNLFTMAANLTGPDLVAAVGYGLPEGRFAFLEDGAGQQAAGQPLANSADEVAGVELFAGADGGKAVRCRAEGCSEGYNITSVPDELLLTIMAPQVSLLSFWFAGVSTAGVWRGGVWHAGGGSTSGGSSGGGSSSGSSSGGGSSSGSGSSGGGSSSGSSSSGGGSSSGSSGGASGSGSGSSGGGVTVVRGGGAVWHGGVHGGGGGCMFWCHGRCRC